MEQTKNMKNQNINDNNSNNNNSNNSNSNSNIVIKVSNLSKEYKLGKVVSDVNFQIKKQGIYGLIGPNGAGKTTIMKMLGGLVLPTEGDIFMLGGSTEEELENARKHMSFMIEIPYVKKDYNAWYNLERTRIMKGISDKKRIEEVLELVGLADVSKKKTVKKYSLGMQQRLGIANALLHEPDVLVLDEPTNGLDPEGIVEIRNLLLRLNQEKGITILISSHILSELSHLCTDYLFINHGKIVKEISSEELKTTCQSALVIHTDDDEKAYDILKNISQTLNIEATKDENFIRITNGQDKTYDIVKALISQGLVPLHISEENKDLEEYYLSILGE